MPMRIHNIEIAAMINRLADFLEIKGDNPFRIRAYRNAARIISTYSKSMAELIEKNEDLTDIPGIGDHIAAKIETIVKTNELPSLKKIEAKMPSVLSELLKIENLGPMRVQKLYKKLKLKNIQDLKKALKKGKIQKIKGFGEKTAKKIQQGIDNEAAYSKRLPLIDAMPISDSLLTYLKKSKTVDKLICAGSFRRRKETVGDLDILITANDKQVAMDHFIKFDEISEILSQGTTRASVRLHSGIHVDLRIVAPHSYGAALIYFTGSKAHNIHLRGMAIKKGLKINEYGVFKNEYRLQAETETEVYQKIGLEFIEPELREDRGEIEAAKKKTLPKLITLKNIRGDLHSHTNATDGKNTLVEMAEAAQIQGYEYLAITDHSFRLGVMRGFDEKKLIKQMRAIDKLNEKLNGFIILKSLEIDILENGKLDLSESLLKQLDLTICSIHSKFGLSEKKQTERIIRAMDNPYFNILAHPTGRLINQRQGYAIDLERIMLAAKERGCFLELNAQPERMDLSDLHCLLAKDLGVKLAISTDAHSISDFRYMQYGIYQARRGWLEAENVINTFPLKQLKKILKR